MTRSITIVGGSIAGLTLAATLDPAAFDVRLIEAEPRRSQYGSALALLPAAQRVLRRLGAWDLLDGEISEPEGGGFYDITGRPVVRVGGPPLRLVERPLVVAAIDAVVPGTVERVAEHVADASPLVPRRAGDLLVGADGVRSVVRALVTDRPDRLETPYIALRGILDHAGRSAPAFGEYWGPGLLFGIAPLTGERAYWFTTHRSSLGPEPLEAQAVLEEARAAFVGSAELVTSTLAQAGAGTSATRLWVAPPMRRYVRGSTVVIGDAAHAMLPNLGRGACDAILDGWTLGRALNGGGSLAAWEARRLPFTQAARLTASAIMRTALSPRVNAARDTFLRR